MDLATFRRENSEKVKQDDIEQIIEWQRLYGGTPERFSNYRNWVTVVRPRRMRQRLDQIAGNFRRERRLSSEVNATLPCIVDRAAYLQEQQSEINTLNQNCEADLSEGSQIIIRY
jgi:hypothetical protein